MKADVAQAVLKLGCNPHSLAWHPSGKALVHSNREDSEADRLAVTDFSASPAKLRAAKDRQISTEDEASHVC